MAGGKLRAGDATGQGQALVEGDSKLHRVPGNLRQVHYPLGGHALHKRHQGLGRIRLWLKLLLVCALQLHSKGGSYPLLEEKIYLGCSRHPGRCMTRLSGMRSMNGISALGAYASGSNS